MEKVFMQIWNAIYLMLRVLAACWGFAFILIVFFALVWVIVEIAKRVKSWLEVKR